MLSHEKSKEVLMRTDIYEGVQLHLMANIKPNYAALAKQYQCDYRTVKRYFDAGIAGELKNLKVRKPQASPLLHRFEALIKDKLDIGCSYKAIFYFLTKHGYVGSYTTVKRYCRNYTRAHVQKATIRIETTPGLSAQVDWKEDLKLVSRSGEIFVINLFLYVLGYSRMKYLEMTFDRKQDTVFGCLINAFDYCGGVPHEIWFDNMKTVVDRSKSQFKQVVFNERFRQFAKDAGFKPIACRPFRPQTKGKVEALARTVDRLLVFNQEFEDERELEQIVENLRDDLNQEFSQAVAEQPKVLLKDELPVLRPYDAIELASYIKQRIETRKVSSESMVLYKGSRYSVPLAYIGKELQIEVKDHRLQIYYGGKRIRSHPVCKERFNYQKEDSKAILRSDVFKYLKDSELDRFVDENLQAYDEL